MPKARKYQSKSFPLLDSLELLFDGEHTCTLPTAGKGLRRSVLYADTFCLTKINIIVIFVQVKLFEN